MYSKGFWSEGDATDIAISKNVDALRRLPAGDFFKPGDKVKSMEVDKVEIGEKYLSIVVLGSIKLAAFPNKAKKDGDKQPDFKGDGVAVWVNTKREKEGVQKSAL